LDHVYWTRLAVLGIVHGVPGLDQTVRRLLRNVDDMLGLMTPDYGEKALAPPRHLMRDQLTVAAILAGEAKAGALEAAQTEKDWYANADDVSWFISSANKHIDYLGTKGMLDRHLAMTKNEAVYRLTEQSDRAISNYEDIEAEALMMADAFASAVMMEFAAKFAQ